MPVLARLLPAVLLCAALAGCGSGGNDDASGPGLTTAPEERSSAPRADTKRADPKALTVIRGWAAAQADGDVEKAATFFALPALIANGTDPVRLTTRAQVRGFNEALPCGAEVTRAYDAARYTVVTFLLTNRPGAECGEGAGGSASTAFQIRDGKIAQWLRVPDDLADQGAAPGTPSPSPAKPSEDRPVV